MTDNQTPIDHTKHVVLILDRSGSMRSIASDTTGGVAQLLSDHAKSEQDPDNPTKRVLVTLAEFDDKYKMQYSRVAIGGVRWECKPRGMTALLDAVGRTINTVRQDDQQLGDQAPGKTVVVIVTDGLENSSTEYDTPAVRKLIGEVESDGWEVIFLGADQNAWETSDRLGIARSHSSGYAKSGGGTRSAYAAASGMTVNSTAGERSRGFSDSDRQAMTEGQPETD